jgi:hypothetical protein
VKSLCVAGRLEIAGVGQNDDETLDSPMLRSIYATSIVRPYDRLCQTILERSILYAKELLNAVCIAKAFDLAKARVLQGRGRHCFVQVASTAESTDFEICER